ncbi:hypothetical protein ACS0TY_017303 [Phlomoides rotata]
MNTTFRKYYLPLFLIITSLLASYTTPTDTIHNSQIFTDTSNSTLISSGGTFEFGFFSLENSKNRYVGMWYKKIPVRTVVCVAKRDNPLTERSGVLRVVKPGILALLNGTGTIIWSTNTSTAVQTPVAQLLDSGNLVVKDANDDDPENFVWQSFNHPTDTLLPGMKLGVNFQTGVEVYITSPKNIGNPGFGDFIFHCDPTGPNIALCHKSNIWANKSTLADKSNIWASKSTLANKLTFFGLIIGNDMVDLLSVATMLKAYVLWLANWHRYGRLIFHSDYAQGVRSLAC